MANLLKAQGKQRALARQESLVALRPGLWKAGLGNFPRKGLLLFKMNTWDRKEHQAFLHPHPVDRLVKSSFI